MKIPSVSLGILALILLSLKIEEATSARILALFTHIGKSHFDVFRPYLEALAARGHDIVVASHFPREVPLENYTDISVKGTSTVYNATESIILDYAVFFKIPLLLEVVLAYNAPSDCRNTFSLPNMQELIQSNQKFDLIITEIFNTDCYLGFVHKFKCPFISFSSSVLMPWANYRFGNPDHPGYIPSLFESTSDRKTFLERLLSTFTQIIYYMFYGMVFERPSEAVARQFFGDDMPPLSEIARNTSLILVNSHFTLNRPRPLVPAIIEVGGLHIKPLKPLPKDLQQFLDASKEGVVYFSLGSMIRSSSLPENKRRALLEAFSELPYAVLWKWEDDAMPGLPSNVRINKWLPQLEILSHPNVRVFMSHGGLLGTIEAVQCAVPMVGIPMFGDQSTNVRNIEAAGMGVTLHYQDITKENVLRALNTVLHEPSYRENALRLSAAYRDRPVSPMDSALYWTEYVLRHNGAPHLRSAAVGLPLYQYLLLDVLGAIGLALCLLYLAAAKSVALLCRRSTKNKQKLQ